MSKVTTTVAAMIFVTASLVLSPAHSAGTAASRAAAIHHARSAR
jgi:hypothetical protein